MEVSGSLRRLAWQVWHWKFALLASAGLGFIALGIFLRSIDHDREGGLLAVRYAAQWPVLAGVAAALAIVFYAGRRCWLCVGSIVVCLACTGAWCRVSWKDNLQQQPGENSARFVYWNVAGPQARLGDVVARAQSFAADFVAIGEAASESDAELAQWRAAFRGQTVLRLRGEMLVATRGVVRSTRYGSLRQKGRYNLLELDLRGRHLRVLVVDFDADATRSRRTPFEALREVVDANADQPLIVMGDFNTPADSPHFKLLGGSLRDAWQTAGRGFSETWPVPLPMLRLDHVWISKEVQPAAFRMDWSLLSDHRAQILEATLH